MVNQNTGKYAADAFDFYERRINRKMAKIPHYNPALPEDRHKIIKSIKSCLGIKTEWAPKIKTRTVQTVKYTSFWVETLAFSSWENVVGSADLYLPAASSTVPPLVLLCCGHGGGGKRYGGYQEAARLLAKQGAAVLLPDNIGQGSRSFMGHRNAVAPFACGTSLQGLIVLETLGWIEWALYSGLFDTARMAAIGNSGGGLLTTLLAALSPDLSALCSSGYPSSFEFIARKEKNLCCCNIIPGSVGKVEIWHLLGCFAPKPLFIFQGANDNMFPEDLFYSTVRKVSRTYEHLHADGNFAYQCKPGIHTWDTPRLQAMGVFLAEKLGLKPFSELNGDERAFLDYSPMPPGQTPENALSADEIAFRLTGISPERNLTLPDIFKPLRKIEPDIKTPRGNAQTILAQAEAFLTCCRRNGKPSVRSAGKAVTKTNQYDAKTSRETSKASHGMED